MANSNSSSVAFLIKSFTTKRSLLLTSSSSSTRLFKSYAETCATLLRRCTASLLLHLGRSLHAHAIRSGLLPDFSVSTKLLIFYSHLNLTADRHRLFHESFAASHSVFVPFAHNFIISQLLKARDVDAAFKLFDQMPHRTPVAWTAMIDGLMKCGRVREALLLYRTCPSPTLCSSTAVVTGFVSNHLYKEALLFFRGMMASGLLPNHITFTSLIKACIKTARFDLSQSILGLVVKTNFEYNVSVCNSLISLFLTTGNSALAQRVFHQMPEKDVISWTAAIDLYARMGHLELARKLFEQMPERNEVSWSTMIARYNQSGNPVEALRLFKTMLLNELRPNLSCLSSVLHSCVSLNDFSLGCMVHCYALKSGLHDNISVLSSLSDIFYKCWKPEYGSKPFASLSEKECCL